MEYRRGNPYPQGYEKEANLRLIPYHLDRTYVLSHALYDCMIRCASVVDEKGVIYLSGYLFPPEMIIGRYELLTLSSYLNGHVKDAHLLDAMNRDLKDFLCDVRRRLLYRVCNKGKAMTVDVLDMRIPRVYKPKDIIFIAMRYHHCVPLEGLTYRYYDEVVGEIGVRLTRKELVERGKIFLDKIFPK